jgi:hypothetical protein
LLSLLHSFVFIHPTQRLVRAIGYAGSVGCANLDDMKLLSKAVFILLVFSGSLNAQLLFQGFSEREDWTGTYFQGQKIGFTHGRGANEQ